MTTFQIYEEVSQMLWMKIEESPRKLDCEHVTKGLIHLDSSIPKWMTLLPRPLSLLFNVDMRYSVVVIPAVEDISSQQWDRVKWLAWFSFVSSAPGYGNGVILNSMDFWIMPRKK